MKLRKKTAKAILKFEGVVFLLAFLLMILTPARFGVHATYFIMLLGLHIIVIGNEAINLMSQKDYLP